MSKRRRKERHRRRERRERQGEDQPAEVSPAPSAPAKEGPGSAMGISWNGLIGAIMGLAPMALIMMDVLINAEGATKLLAVVPAVMGSLFLPAAWASVARTERRMRVLRISVLVSLVVAFTTSFVFATPVILLVLLPATAMLWIATGAFRPRTR